MIKNNFEFIKNNQIIQYVLLIFVYFLLANLHANIVDYFRIQFATEAVSIHEASLEGVKRLSADIPQSVKNNYLKLEFDFKLAPDVGAQSLFQTASGNQGIRLEFSPDKSGMVLADSSAQDKTVTFEINKKIVPDVWSHIKIEALQKAFILINLDRKLVVNTRDYRPQFDISEIVFGKSLSEGKGFGSEIRNINLSIRNVGDVRWLDILLTIFSIFIMVACIYVITNSAEAVINDSLSELDNGAYESALFFVYVAYLGSFFVTNYFSKKEVVYWPIMLIVLAPFKWRWLLLSRLSLPLPSGLSLVNVRRSIDCVKTPAMAALFIYIANKAVVSWLLPSNQPPLDYFITEYFFGLAVFFVGFIRLAVDLKNFFCLFFLWLSPLVAINGIINIYIYPETFSQLLGFGGSRLSPSFGSGVDIYATTSAALTYAMYFYGLLMALMHMLADQYTWRKKSLFFIPFLPILLLSLYFTHTRGAMLGLVVACCLYFGLLLRIRTSSLLRNKRLVLFILGSILLLIPLFIKYFHQRDDSFRFEVWSRSYDLMREYFLFGSGDRGFGRYENSGKLLLNIVLTNGLNIPHAHNIFFNALIRGGLIGIISLVALFFFAAKGALRYALTSRELIPLGALTIFLVAGLFDFDLHIYPGAWMLTSNWVPLLMAAATCSFYLNKANETKYAVS